MKSGSSSMTSTAATTTAAALEVQLSKTFPVRVRPWQELAPELADYVQFNRRVTFILFFIFFLLAVMGIVNTMLMAIIERTRELGMLMALGMRPVQVVGLIVAEAASLAGASLVLGGALGSPLLWYLQVHGLNLGGEWRRGLSGRNRGGPPLVRSAGFHCLHSGRSGAGRSRLWRRPSIPRCARLAFGRRRRSERFSDDGCSPAGEDRVAQSLAQSPRDPADGAGLGFGSDLAADFFGLARWQPRANGW